MGILDDFESSSPQSFNQQVASPVANVPQDPGIEQKKNLNRPTGGPFVAEINGTYYHVPTVVDGKQLSQDDASKLFVTGQLAPVSKFKTQESALAALNNGNNTGQSSPHIQEGYVAPPSYARPSTPFQQNPQPSLAGMNQDQMKAVNEALPESTRSIQTIRGNKEGWYNPQQSREFATLGESMRGQPGEATYDSNQKMAALREHNTTLENVQKLQNQGKIDAEITGINLADQLANRNNQGKSTNAADVVNKVEGGVTPEVSKVKNITEDALRTHQQQMDDDARQRAENEQWTAFPTPRRKRSYYDMEYSNPRSGT
jgi:hypothetical protein